MTIKHRRHKKAPAPSSSSATSITSSDEDSPYKTMKEPVTEREKKIRAIYEAVVACARSDHLRIREQDRRGASCLLLGNQHFVDDQEELEDDVIPYRNKIHYGPQNEQRTCIWVGGKLSWTELSSGIPWIGVNSGTSTTCVVAMNGKTSIRPSGRRPLRTCDLLNTILADIGVWADTTTDFTKFRQDMRDQGYKEGPFSVVSVAPDATVEDHYLNISDKCQEEAIDFLKQSLEDRPSLTFKETKQIAVCALQHLLGTEFKSDKIEVWSTGSWRGGNGIMSAGEVDRISTSSPHLPRALHKKKKGKRQREQNLNIDP